MIRKFVMAASAAAMVFALAAPAGAAPDNLHEAQLFPYKDSDATGHVKITERRDGSYRLRVDAKNLSLGTFELIWTDGDPSIAYSACTFTVTAKNINKTNSCSGAMTVPTDGTPWAAAVRRVGDVPGSEAVGFF